jgi:hypothetical protein
MKVVFLIRHLSNYRLLGPVVDQALRAGLQVECWPDYGFSAANTKTYLFPDKTLTPRFAHGQPVVDSYNGPGELAARLERSDAGAVVSLTPLPLDLAGTPLGRRPASIMLQSGPDTFHYESAHLASTDLLALHTPWWLGWGAGHRAAVDRNTDESALRAQLEPRCRYVGFPEAEAVNLVDRDEVRRRWGIPAGRPVVVLLPFPQGVGKQSFWPKNIFAESRRVRRVLKVVARREFGYMREALGQVNDAALVRALKLFCVRNGAFLLVKSREKTPIPDYLRAVADRCVYDEGYYPPTVVEALSIANLCVSYYSLGVLEATALGVPHLCVAFRADDYLGRRPTPAEASFFDTFFTRRTGGVFEWPGVTRTLSAAEAIDLLPGRTLSDFANDADSQRRYQEQFFGPLDGQAAVRAVRAIEDVAMRCRNAGNF